jgi:polysaccharide biosynthesis transport protein
MELRQLYGLARRWAWLILLGTIMAAGAGYYFSNRQTPVYRSTTKIVVIYAYQTGNYSYNYQSSVDLLPSTYSVMLSTTPVLSAVSERVGFPVSAGQITSKINTDADTILISVDDSNPGHATLLANTLVDVLIEHIEALQSGRYANLEETIQAQITQVESQSTELQKQIDQASTANVEVQTKQARDQIGVYQAEISSLQAEIDQLTQRPATGNQPSPTLTIEDKTAINDKKARLAQIQPILAKYQEIYSNLIVLGQANTSGDGNKISQMQKTLDLYQQIYLQLLSNQESVRLARLQNTSTAQQIEPATTPSSPISPKKTNDTMLAGIIGLIVMGGISFLIEYLDDTLKTPHDIKKTLGLPVMGYIAEIDYKRKNVVDLHVAKQPRSPVSEAFRTLRTNLEFASVNTPLQTILVTSTGAEEGKSTIAVNLAAIMAMGGKKVLLVDADLRKPTIHKYLGISNRLGLSDSLREGTNPQSCVQIIDGVDGLNVITSGSIPPNPTELLGSERMRAFLQDFKKITDVIIIDSPPFIVADAQVLSAKVDGVLLVVKPGRIRSGVALTMLEQFRESGVKMLGVVLNKIQRNHSYDYGGYHYYYSYKRGYSYSYGRKEPAQAGDEASQNFSEPLG